MAAALEVINYDQNVKSIFINIFGGITRGEEVANGIVEALSRVDMRAPIVIRLDGTNAEEGRAILRRRTSSDRLQSKPTMLDAARTAVALANGSGTDMASSSTRTPRSSSRASPAARAGSTACATRPTAPRSSPASTPGQGRPGRRGHPDLRLGRRGRRGHRRHRVVRRPCRPRRRRPPSSRRPRPASPFVVCITEGIPAQDEARVLQHARSATTPAPGCSARTAPASSAPASATSASPPARSPSRRAAASPGRHRQPLRHAHLPGAVRAEAAGHRRDRPASASAATRCPAPAFIDCLAAFEADPDTDGGHDDRRDRRLGRGGGGRVHRGQR